ncbi:RNA binding proteinidentical [Aphelenchoides avenae]|nr:RNA binding proteinidentical [Aphelenchus avenae]
MSSVYVGSLPDNAAEDDVESFFSQIGPISNVRIMRDADTGDSKGFGFVEFEDQESVQNAVDRLDGQELLGRRVKVSRAKK